MTSKTWEIQTNDQLYTCRAVPASRCDLQGRGGGAAAGYRRCPGFGGRPADSGAGQWEAGRHGRRVPAARGKYHRDGRPRPRACSRSWRQPCPATSNLSIVMDRTPTIRGSLQDVERTLVLSAVLVILVVFGFLRSGRATVIPGVAVGYRSSAPSE